MWPNWYLGALHEADDEYCVVPSKDTVAQRET